MKNFSERHLSMNIRTRYDAYDDKHEFPSASTLLVYVTPLPFLYHTYSIMSMICLTNKLSIEFIDSGANRRHTRTGGFSSACANAARITPGITSKLFGLFWQYRARCNRHGCALWPLRAQHTNLVIAGKPDVLPGIHSYAQRQTTRSGNTIVDETACCDIETSYHAFCQNRHPDA